MSPEEQRKRTEERVKLLNDALEVYRRAGAALEPIELPANNIAGMIGFILNAEAAAAFDDLAKKTSPTSLNTWPNAFRTHRFVPAVEHIRAARARC